MTQYLTKHQPAASPAVAPAALALPHVPAAGATLFAPECGAFIKAGDITIVCSGVSTRPGFQTEISWYSYAIVNGSAQPRGMGKCSVAQWFAMAQPQTLAAE